jgi:Fe-S-cluster containining protein
MSVFIVESRCFFLVCEVGFDYPSGLRFECTLCGLCCGDAKQKLRHVLLLRSEVQRIATQTNKHASSFASKIDGKTPYTYEMKKSIDGKCIFLNENKCTIYSLRPLICRFYPFELTTDEKGKVTIRSTMECPAIGTGKELKAEYFKKLYLLAQAELAHA